MVWNVKKSSNSQVCALNEGERKAPRLGPKRGGGPNITTAATTPLMDCWGREGKNSKTSIARQKVANKSKEKGGIGGISSLRNLNRGHGNTCEQRRANSLSTQAKGRGKINRSHPKC